MKLFATYVLFLIMSMKLMATTPTITYTLSMPKPSTHILEVELTFDGLPSTDSTLVVALPSWRTGRYVILELANGIVEFNALNGAGEMLRSKKVNKNSWSIETRGLPVINIRYKVYANEFALRTRGLNDERAFVDGTGVFLYSERYRDLPLTLNVVPFGNWHVTTGLDSVGGKTNTFSASNYDYLADCPLEIGTQKDFQFTVKGKPHVLSISGDGKYDVEKLIRDVSKIAAMQIEFWGHTPFNRYVFMIALSANGHGGTEHINSTIIGLPPSALSHPDHYHRFLSIVSHEYFHTWNVKQLRPAGINMYDWERENYLEELWIAEGMTSYYGGLFLVRSGLLTESRYVESLPQSIEGDMSRPGNKKQSLAECSFDAWIKLWKNTPQAYNFEADYYSRGANVSLILDMTIREQTKNRRSLDDVMRLMHERFPLGLGGYTNADFQKACEEVAEVPFQDFFANYVYGVMPLPWDDVLATAGLELEEKLPEKTPWLGILTNELGGKTVIRRVIASSPAYEAGLDVDDELLALNGYKVRTQELAGRLSEFQEGDTVRVTVFREEKLREFVVRLRFNEIQSRKITKSKSPNSLQKAVLKSWLGTTADATKQHR